MLIFVIQLYKRVTIRALRLPQDKVAKKKAQSIKQPKANSHSFLINIYCFIHFAKYFMKRSILLRLEMIFFVIY